jgi:hypothetical protein
MYLPTGDGVLCEELRGAHPRRGGHQGLHGGDAGARQADHRRQHQEQGQIHHSSSALRTIVGDPEPDPQDPHVFVPPGSRSISQRHGSSSGSFFFLVKVLSGLK